MQPKAGQDKHIDQACLLRKKKKKKRLTNQQQQQKPLSDFLFFFLFLFQKRQKSFFAYAHLKILHFDLFYSCLKSNG